MRLVGLTAAVHTPFGRDGSLDLAVVERQAEHLVRSGVQAAFVGGTTGESHSLTVPERLALADRWLQVAGKGPLSVVVHVGCNCQADCMELSRAAGRGKAAAIAVLAPSYFKPATVADLVDFTCPIAAAAPETPVYYYDIPALTGVNLSTRDFLEEGSKKIPNLAGAKFTNMDLMTYGECLRLEGGRFDVVFGYDEAYLAAVAMGAKGAVGSGFNFAAPIYNRLQAAFDAGDLGTARDRQADGVRLIRILLKFGYLSASKACMKLLGIDCGPVRSPLRLLTDAEVRELRGRLEEGGLWESLRS